MFIGSVAMDSFLWGLGGKKVSRGNQQYGCGPVPSIKIGTMKELAALRLVSSSITLRSYIGT